MAPLTADQLVEQALGRIGEVTSSYPSARGPMYRRIGIRQRQLFVRASQINPDYYGRSVTTTLTDGAVDLSALDEVPELLQRVEIADVGTSDYDEGQEVALVSMTDPAGELAPRMTVRSLSLAQVGTDLAGVNGLRLWYTKLPASIGFDGGSTTLELDAPWDGLLEVDLAMWIVEKATALNDNVRAAALASFQAEEAQLLNDFDAHLRTVAPTVQRFVNPLTRPGVQTPAPSKSGNPKPA